MDYTNNGDLFGSRIVSPEEMGATAMSILADTFHEGGDYLSNLGDSYKGDFAEQCFHARPSFAGESIFAEEPECI